MPEIFEFIDISCRLFFFLLDQEKESKRNQDAAIPPLLAQFLSLHHPQPRSIIHRIIAVPRAALKLAHR
jgi:hypothetical protein